MMNKVDGEPPFKKHRIDLSISTENKRYIDVGIEQFLDNEGIGFNGKIKERWEDFIVNEVDLNKKIIYLSNMDLPDSKIQNTIIENKHLDASIINDLKDLHSESGKKEIIIDAPEDKVIRTEIYNYIKAEYPSFYGNTEMREGKRVFIITNYADERSKIAKRIKQVSGEDEYCQFVLYKEGKDTISAIDLISKYLKMKHSSFTYAGTKDRRGITSQLVTVRSCAANRLKGLNKCLNGISLGNFIYVPIPLKLGDLYGNRFKLVIREVDSPDEHIAVAITRFQKGFINYFGMQRFGSTNIRSYEIGKLAIASDWEKMINLILEPTEQDLPFMRDCKTQFKTDRDCTAFLGQCKTGIEKSLVTGVAKHGYTLNAIDNLPRNLRQLYVHSYQSYVWNRIVSRRFRQQDGQSVLAGDLIERENKIFTVEAHEISQYSLEDVLLPLPGFDIKLPDNEIASWYREILAEDGLEINELRHRVKDFSLPGSYRKLVVVPEDLQYTICNYSDCVDSLIETDFQRMNNTFQPPLSQGPLKAVVVEFTLPKSAYATIAIRELMRTVQVIQ